MKRPLKSKLPKKPKHLKKGTPSRGVCRQCGQITGGWKNWEWTRVTSPRCASCGGILDRIGNTGRTKNLLETTPAKRT